MSILNSKDIDKISQLMVAAFAEDPKIQYQLRNIERKKFILKIQLENQLRGFLKNGDIHVLNDLKGIVIGYNSRKINCDEYIKLVTNCSEKLLKVITEQEMQTIIRNSEMLSEVDNPFWFDEINEEYYHLMIIAIDKQVRGSGAFRKLISPVICECNVENIPILLETHNKRNVEIYKHFGFEIVKEFVDEKIEFSQYCMVRQPTLNF